MKEKIEPITFVLGIISIILSISFILLGVEFNQTHFVAKDDLISISATVSKISVLKDSDGMDDYRASVTYTYDGETYQDKGWKSISKGEYEIGEEVSITINPHSPDKPYTYSGSITGYISGGIVCFVFGICMFVLSFRIRKGYFQEYLS